MECPYCSEELKKGFIKTYGENIAWTPDGEVHPRIRWERSKNSVEIAHFNVLNGACSEAYYCPKCRCVIIKIK